MRKLIGFVPLGLGLLISALYLRLPLSVDGSNGVHERLGEAIPLPSPQGRLRLAAR
jgi:hypothetical protein